MVERKLKPGWNVYRFEEMAANIIDRVEPEEAGAVRYVGLEHLDPESLKIRRWGSPKDVGATKFLFKSGDIIFGKRRAYQRKLAVADFDGICSAHAMVLRAKEDVVLPEFLPFFMQSDLFMNRAVEISVGSLSPTINWRTLAKEEFALPPPAEQFRLVKKLGAMDRIFSRIDDAINCSHSLEMSIVDYYLNTLRERGVKPVSLIELCMGRLTYGLNASAVEYRSDFPRFLRITDIDSDGNLLNDDMVSVKVNNPELYRVERGDLLFARTGNTVGKVYLATGEEYDCVYAGYLVRARPDKKQVYPPFLFAFTRSSFYKSWLERNVRVGAQPNINATEYGKLPIWLPSFDDQRDLIEQVTSIRRSRRLLSKRIYQTLRMKSAYMNKILDTGA